MQNTEQINNDDLHTPKPSFWHTNRPLVIGAIVLILGSVSLGYTVGHRQGLTVVGYDADAEQLVEVVQKQKTALDAVNKSLNATVQERDVAVSNANDLYQGITQAKNDKAQMEGMSALYREILRQRGGLSLTIQDLAIKPLPENAFEYQLDLVQVSPNKRRATGSVEMRLIQGDEILVVPLEDNNFNFDTGQQIDVVFFAPVYFCVTFLQAAAKYLADGHAGNPDFI